MDLLSVALRPSNLFLSCVNAVWWSAPHLHPAARVQAQPSRPDVPGEWILRIESLLLSSSSGGQSQAPGRAGPRSHLEGSSISAAGLPRAPWEPSRQWPRVVLVSYRYLVPVVKEHA